MTLLRYVTKPGFRYGKVWRDRGGDPLLAWSAVGISRIQAGEQVILFATSFSVELIAKASGSSEMETFRYAHQDGAGRTVAAKVLH